MAVVVRAVVRAPFRRIVPALAAAAMFLTGCAGGAGSGQGAPAAAGSQQGGSGTTAESAPTALGFSGSTLDGTRLDAATLSGQPVVLWFWAPWCTICRAEAPDVAAVAAELDGTVTFLGIPGRGPEDDMRRFVDETGTTGFDHVVDADGSLWQRFGVVSQPSFVFVAADGSAESFAGSLPADQLRQKASSLANG